MTENGDAHPVAEPRGVPVVMFDVHECRSDPIYLRPGPQSARPGFAPVCSPSLSTCTPLTNTCRTPTAYWCGFSNVARSAIVAGIEDDDVGEHAFA